MSTHHGKDAVLKLGANTVTETVEWSIEETADTADDTAQGDAWDTHLLGQKKWTATVTCHFNPADTNGQNALAIGASGTGNFYPIGTGAGAGYKQGTFTVTRRGTATPLRDKVALTLTLMGNGALTDQVVGA